MHMVFYLLVTHLKWQPDKDYVSEATLKSEFLESILLKSPSVKKGTGRLSGDTKSLNVVPLAHDSSNKTLSRAQANT